MILDIPIEEIYGEVKDNTVIVRSKKLLKILSSAVFNGSLQQADTIVCYGLPDDYDDAELHNEGAAEKLLESIVKTLKLHSNHVVGLITAVNPHNVAVTSQEYHGLTVTAIVTGGTGNTASTAGDSIASENNHYNAPKPGTINTILLVNGNLTKPCMVDAVKTATEAKSAALREIDVRSYFSGELATGTITDSIVIACKCRGNIIKYAGPFTTLGELIGKSVRKSVKEAFNKQDGIVSNRSLIERLEERDITLEDLTNMILEFYSHLKNLESRKELRSNLIRTLLEPNVAALAMAGLRLEEDRKYNLIPSFTEMVKNNSRSFIANKILGKAIADFIAGSSGINEYNYLNKIKLENPKKLGLFLNDVIRGIIAGVYSTLHRKG